MRSRDLRTLLAVAVVLFVGLLFVFQLEKLGQSPAVCVTPEELSEAYQRHPAVPTRQHPDVKDLFVDDEDVGVGVGAGVAEEEEAVGDETVEWEDQEGGWSDRDGTEEAVEVWMDDDDLKASEEEKEEREEEGETGRGSETPVARDSSHVSQLVTKETIHVDTNLSKCLLFEMVVTVETETEADRQEVVDYVLQSRGEDALYRIEAHCMASLKEDDIHTKSVAADYVRTLPVRMRAETQDGLVIEFGTEERRELPYEDSSTLVQLVATFFPDDSSDKCTFTLIKRGGQVLGKYERDLEETPVLTANCWWCYPIMHYDLPIARDFYVANAAGKPVDPTADLRIFTETSTELWIRPTPQTLAMYPEAVRQALFNAFLSSEDIIQAVYVSESYDEAMGGYRIAVSPRDAISAQLIVTLQMFYGSGEPDTDDREPVLVSSHMSHEINNCDLTRSEIYGSRVLVVPRHKQIGLPSMYVPEAARKCTKFSEEGRWLRHELETECEFPYCTGDKEAAEISTMSWQGTRFEYIWVPFECQYHFYNSADLKYCGEENDIKWIHVMGDSLPREIAGYMMSVFGMPDTQKFEQSDSMMNSTNIRLTFQTWPDMLIAGPRTTQPHHRRDPDFLRQVLDHYNLLEPGTSRSIYDTSVLLQLPIQEEDAPDVFFMNPASAYALFQQSRETYTQFMEDFMALVGNRWDASAGGRRRTKAWWYGHPYVHGTAHAGSEFLTEPRNKDYRDITKKYLEGHDIPYLNPAAMTSCRYEESFDGLHYLLGVEHWVGHVSGSVVQAILNEVMGECAGPPQ